MTKTIENKSTSLMVDEKNSAKYADLLITLVNQPIKEGITLKQMKYDLALLAKLETAKSQDVIEVEQDELDKLKELSASFLWGTRHIDIANFGDYIESL